MPSTSVRQHNLMAMVANNPKAAKRVGIPQSVGQEFMKADKGKKFGSGGQTRADMQSINKPRTHHGKTAFFAEGGAMKESKAMEMRHAAEMKKHGVPKKYVKEEMAEAAAMKRGGGVKKMASGGFVRAADGVAQKGKTKAKQIKMSMGGKC